MKIRKDEDASSDLVRIRGIKRSADDRDEDEYLRFNSLQLHGPSKRGRIGGRFYLEIKDEKASFSSLRRIKTEGSGTT